MATQAALDGVKRFGVGWKLVGPRLSHLNKEIAKFMDLEVAPSDEEINGLIHTLNLYYKTVESWMAKRELSNNDTEVEIFDNYRIRVEEGLENISELDKETLLNDLDVWKEEIRATLDILYDEFDYYRINVR